MIDDTNTMNHNAETTASPSAGSDGRIGFCQECGRALTPGTLQRVGSGVFCLPCSVQRQTYNGWQSVSAGGYAGAGAPPRQPGEPNPVLAGILGMIPGVGAMYNGQYAKGAMHLIVFVVLVTLADNLNWVFYWLVWGWVFYQAFDAYHTARARRDGLPLPNPFGWNDIGERLGFSRTAAPPVGSTPNPAAYTSRGPEPASSWAGYVPPSGPAQARYTPPAPQPQSQSTYSPPPPPTVEDNPYTAPYAPPVPPVGPRPVPVTNVPYVPTFTGPVQNQPVVPQPAYSSGRRFPIGALWLIGLGVLFLLGNLLPEWRLSGRWLVPVLLATLAAWGAFRRWEQYHLATSSGFPARCLAGALSGPVMLFTVAFLLALQAASLLPMHRSWPVLLVVWGSMLLIQRVSSPTPPTAQVEMMQPAAPPPVRSTSGTGSLGL